MQTETFEQFLQRQERELPRLPVPPLQQTMKAYLLSTKPFLTEEEYKTTEKVATEFFTSELAAKLQKFLEERAAKEKNWLADWWLHAAYLDVRTPLPVFSNNAALFPPVHLTSDFNYLNLAAAAISGVLDLKTKLIDKNIIPPMKISKNVLCMDQAQRYYSTCRIPGEKRDHLRISKPTKHIVVIRRNHIFIVPVYDKSGKLLNQRQILSQLNTIVEQSQIPSPTPIGVLTTEERPVWWRARETLLKASEENLKNFDLIETGIFVVYLDKALSEKELQKGGRLQGIVERSMHGGNVDISEAGNRWVDIICQLVITESGEIGNALEHSPIEANQLLYNHILDFWTINRGKDEVPPAGVYDPPNKLNFTVPDQVQDTIAAALSNAKALASLLETYPFAFRGFGRNVIRDLKVGTADSFVQLAIQLTFYKLYKTPGAQYETASTRTFLLGRTETIRSCSVDSVHFARTMLDPRASDVEKARVLRCAAAAHKDCVLKAMMGHGVDRHLLGLRLAAAEHNLEIPTFFQDPGYTRSINMRLSTSQVPAKVSATAAFSPLTSDGYGCCYNILPDEVAFGVTTYTTCPDTSAVRFSHVLGESLDEMKLVASAAMPPDNKL